MDKTDKNNIITVLHRDMLKEIFSKQSRFQHALGYNVEFLEGKDAQEYINWNSLAMIDEIMEALRETPWKPWKKKQQIDFSKYRKELVDLLHFFVNACLVSGFTAESLFSEYLEKMEENVDRQINNY